MTLYTYEKKFNIGANKIHCYMGVKENKLTNIIEKFSYIIKWFSIGFLYYLNTTYIHSNLFAVFVFIVGISLLQTLTFERKTATKKEFLEKVNMMLGDEE